MFNSVLVANRGEIACRVIATLRALGVRSIAIYSDADEGAKHVEMADVAVHVGGSRPAESYLDTERIVRAAVDQGADAVHPGYGFLAENAGFARAVEEAGITWIGPRPATIESMGNKAEARTTMSEVGFPVNGTKQGGLGPDDDALAIAAALGYPVMVKAANGGGGIGMQIVRAPDVLLSTIERTRDQAERLFGDGAVMIERYLEGARHVELQILGLADGRVAVLGERDCSVQRRFQKVIEETPSPGVDADLRRRMFDAGRTAGEALGYLNAGTIECLVAGEDFYFLEVNTRLQVEHPVTELVTGVDLVAEQLRVAAGMPPTFDPDEVPARGHAIEYRVYAEDSQRFFPSPGIISGWSMPDQEHVRVDAGYRAGDQVTTFYDPLVAKVSVWGPDRETALDRSRTALEAVEISGVKTNVPFLLEVLTHDDFVTGSYDTRLVSQMRN